MVRGLDHVVVAVKDLAAACRAFEDLGFTVTPENRHSWGTWNRLIQLDGFFIELLTVGDASAITEPGVGEFSFGAFNRNFLERREGGSMLVVDSVGPEADRSELQEAGVEVFAPFSFQRTATYQDGSTSEVGFNLTFARDPQAPEIGFFRCHNRFPENFWKPEFQRHANGARGPNAVYLIAWDPSDHHEFLGGFTGQREMRATSLGLELQTARGRIVVLSPSAYGALIEDGQPESGPAPLPRIAALEIACAGLTERRVVPSAELFGLTLILSPDT